MNLDWLIENKTVPWEVTQSLQVISDKYNYSVDYMHQHIPQIIDELRQMEKGYIVSYLFPYGFDHYERWFML
jgi:hypothetical protein